VASAPLLVRGGRGNTGQTPHPISARAHGHFRIPTRFPPRHRHSHPRAAAGNRIFRRILFYGVGIRGLLARTSFRPVKSEYRALYSRFTGQKNRESFRHALRCYFMHVPYLLFNCLCNQLPSFFLLYLRHADVTSDQIKNIFLTGLIQHTYHSTYILSNASHASLKLKRRRKEAKR
jgi:hypothetical protein